MASITALLLQTAMTLLLLVQGNPNIDPSLRDQAITIANQAITTATEDAANRPTPSPTSQRPIIDSVNGKGGFGTGDSNYILGKNFATVTDVWLANNKRVKTTLGWGFDSDTRINVSVPNSLPKDTYYLYVKTKYGTSIPYWVGSIGTNTSGITVISPNGGEIYQKGDAVQYVWSQNYESEEGLEVHLINFDTGKEYYSASINGGVGKNTDIIPREGTNVPTGRYRITICDEGVPPGATFKPLCGTSDSYFKIVSSTSAPSITVISPNGGEIWHPGETHRITWKSSNVSNMNIYVYDSNISGSGSTNYITPNNSSVSATQGYYSWTIPEMTQLPPFDGYSSGGGNYRIRIDDADGVDLSYSDRSDAPFGIYATGFDD